MNDLVHKMTTNLLDSKSDNTAKSYYYSFKKWKDFISEKGYKDIPAQPIHVALYITHLMDKGASVNTVNSVIYSIKWVHELYNLTDPTNNSYIKSLQECAKRKPKTSNKKEPITKEILLDLCKLYDRNQDLTVIRDLCMILIAFTGFLRYNELSLIKCSNVTIEEDFVKIVIEKSKTDQYRNGNEIYIAKGQTEACPHAMLLKYIELSKTELKSDMYLFRPIFKTKKMTGLIHKNKPLSYTRARETIISRIKMVAPNLNIGLHSMRSGGATEVAKHDVNERCIKRHGRWKQDISKDRYIVDSVEKRLQVTKSMNL